MWFNSRNKTLSVSITNMHVLSSLYYVNVPFRAAKMKLLDDYVSETKDFP